MNMPKQGKSILETWPKIVLGPSTFTTKVVVSTPEPVFLNLYGVQESIPRNEFRQPM